MPLLADVILQFHDLANEKPYRDQLNKPGGLPNDYIGHLAAIYNTYNEERLPAIPPAVDGVRRGITVTVQAHVSSGRWVWKCRVCNSGQYAEVGFPSCCPVCFVDGWVNVEFPDDRKAIEEELLKQPGRRSFAPIRNWFPGQTLADIEDRTKRANEKMAAGETDLRSLSIGSTRTWAVAEILTAANMNTALSAILNDLAGRNGEIQLEGPLKINDGAGKYFELPVLTTTQRDALTPANGMVIYNSTVSDKQSYINGAWVSGLDLTSQVLTGFAEGDVLYVNSSGVLARLGAGTAGQFFKTNGAAAAPSWQTEAAGVVRCTDASGQLIAAVSWATINFDTESSDTDGFHDTVTNNERFTVPSGLDGTYLVGFSGRFTGQFTASGIRARIQLNNTTYIAHSGDGRNDAVAPGEDHMVCVTTLIELVATDFVEVEVYNNKATSGDTLEDQVFYMVQVA